MDGVGRGGRRRRRTGCSLSVISGRFGGAEVARGEPPARNACRRAARFSGTAVRRSGWRGDRRTSHIVFAISMHQSVGEVVVDSARRAQGISSPCCPLPLSNFFLLRCSVPSCSSQSIFYRYLRRYLLSWYGSRLGSVHIQGTIQNKGERQGWAGTHTSHQKVVSR